jgi:hypothetical protein
LTKYLSGTTGNALDHNIFATSPLVAAYYLLNTPTSHIALQLVTIGAPAWQQDVERIKRSGELNTVIEEAARLISASRYRIVRFDGARFRERVGKTLKMKASAAADSAQAALGFNVARGTRGMDSASSATAPLIEE